MYVTLSIHRPQADEIRTITSGEDGLPVGIRFGAPAAVGQGELAVFLSYANYAHEGQWVEAVSACDALLETVNAVRNAALKKLAALRPDEELIGFISDATEAVPPPLGLVDEHGNEVPG